MEKVPSYFLKLLALVLFVSCNSGTSSEGQQEAGEEEEGRQGRLQAVPARTSPGGEDRRHRRAGCQQARQVRGAVQQLLRGPGQAGRRAGDEAGQRGRRRHGQARGRHGVGEEGGGRGHERGRPRGPRWHAHLLRQRPHGSLRGAGAGHRRRAQG